MEPTNKGPKACTTCAKAKARCIPGPERASKCERCQRLNKECVSQRPAPPRAKKAPKRSRVAELEKRLDELSSQFVDGVVAVTPMPSLSLTTGPASELTASSQGLSVTERPGGQQQQKLKQTQPRQRSKCEKIATFEYLFPSPRSESAEASGWSSEAGSNDFGGAAADALWPTPVDAEAMLLMYNETHAPLVPFVVVPKHLTAAELQRQRPFLWRVVMMVASFTDGPKQQRMGKEVLAEIGGMAVMDGSRSLEMLQGLLLLIGWQSYTLKSTQLTNLLFLARSMSVNAAGVGAPGVGQLCGNNTSKHEVRWGELEHVRAYLGTYYANAVVFNSNKKADAYMNTSQLDAYCNLLTSPGEYASDVYLARLVKIQMLSQSISMAMTFDPAQQQPPMQLPLMMMVQTFQEQIDAYRSSLPPHLVENGTIRCHMAISEILLADIAISDSHCSSLGLPLNDRIQLLWTCLGSLNRFYKAHAETKCGEISEKERRRFLSLNASDLAYAIITGIKMLLVRLPGWDPLYIISQLGVREMLDKEIRELSVVVAKRESDQWLEEDPMVRMHMLLKFGRELVDLQLQKLKAEMNVGSSSSDSASMSSPPMVMMNKGEGGAQGWMMMGIEDLDDELWQNFMNDTMWNLNGEPMVMDTF